MPWGIVAGAVIGGLGARSAARQQDESARKAAELAYERSLPWNTTGMFGTAQFDPDSRESFATLSPEMQQQYEQVMERAARTGAEIDRFDADPYKMQQQLSQEQQALFAPSERQDVLNLEARQLAQGRSGTRGGAGEMQGMFQGQQQKQLAREVQAFDQAQNYLTNLRGRQTADLGQAVTIGALPDSYLNIGRGIGAGMSSAAQAGATMMNVAGQNRADSTAAFWSNLGNTVGSYGKADPQADLYKAQAEYFRRAT